MPITCKQQQKQIFVKTRSLYLPCTVFCVDKQSGFDIPFLQQEARERWEGGGDGWEVATETIFEDDPKNP